MTFSCRSDDQLEVQDISDSESGNVMPGYARLQSRLNPVPESLNSPDIAPGKKQLFSEKGTSWTGTTLYKLQIPNSMLLNFYHKPILNSTVMLNLNLVVPKSLILK